MVKNKKKKIKYRSYLAGPIGDVSLDEARDWRDMLTGKLGKMGIGVLDPLSKYGEGLPNIRRRFAIWKKVGNIDALRQVVANQIIPRDLEMVEECDFVTLYIPAEGKEICGSYGEATYAFHLGKPVFIVTDRRLKPLNIPKWVIGCSTKVFKTWKDYLKYIKINWDDGDD